MLGYDLQVRYDAVLLRVRFGKYRDRTFKFLEVGEFLFKIVRMWGSPLWIIGG